MPFHDLVDHVFEGSLRARIVATNRLLSEIFGSDTYVRYLDIGAKFLDVDRTAGGEAALTENGAEFYAICTAFSGSQAGVDRFGTQLKNYLAHSVARDPTMIGS